MDFLDDGNCAFGPPRNPAHEDMATEGVCPRCGETHLHREEADVGVGVIYGPYGCPCGWSEWQQYDSKYGEGAKFDAKGGYTDIYGVYWPHDNPVVVLMKKAEAAS